MGRPYRADWAYLVGRIVRAFIGTPRQRRIAKERQERFTKQSKADRDAVFVAQMRELSRHSDESARVSVMDGSGKRRTTDNFAIVPLDTPRRLRSAQAFISAAVRIETVHYEFHAYIHPAARIRSGYWLYFSVTGPARERFNEGEFQITDEFRWTGERPLNPLLVKHVLKIWQQRPEVRAAIDAARWSLPK